MNQIKRTHIPLRREEIRDLAHHFRERYAGWPIERVAEREKIILLRGPSPANQGGFSNVTIEEDSDGLLRPIPAIVINTAYRTPHGEPVPEREIFWHEFYHSFYSPASNDLSVDHDHYSTRGALHAQEERRAQEFAAWMLVERLALGDTPHDLAERYAVSTDLARIALQSRTGQTGFD